MVQKVAVITGASRGIGAGLVKAYRDRSYHVVATARSILPSTDDGIVTVPGDVSDPKTPCVSSQRRWSARANRYD